MMEKGSFIGAQRRSLLELEFPSVDIRGGHSLWNFHTAFDRATQDTVKTSLTGDRAAELYLNKKLELSELDLSRLKKIIAKEHAPEYYTRSFWFDLYSPIPDPDASFNTIKTIQIKGIVFDSRREPVIYTGGPQRYAYAAKNSLACMFDVPQLEKSGTCCLREAINEYLMCHEARRRLPGSDVLVPTPIGWGHFETENIDTATSGFVILGTAKIPTAREERYFSAVRTLLETSNFEPLKHLLSLRARAMHMMHSQGLVAPYRHFGNMSVINNEIPLMHDLGDNRALTREDMLSDNQFITETFIHLKYALTPVDMVVPRPDFSSATGQAPVSHLDAYTRATLTGYYGEDSPNACASWVEAEEAFLCSFQTPLTEMENRFAQEHCQIVRKWLQRRGNAYH